jgi:hypothetical protein
MLIGVSCLCLFSLHGATVWCLTFLFSVSSNGRDFNQQLKNVQVLKNQKWQTVCVFLQSVFLNSGASNLAGNVCSEALRCRLYQQTLSVTRDNVLVEEINAYFVTYLKHNA